MHLSVPESPNDIYGSCSQHSGGKGKSTFINFGVEDLLPVSLSHRERQGKIPKGLCALRAMAVCSWGRQ